MKVMVLYANAGNGHRRAAEARAALYSRIIRDRGIKEEHD